MKTIGKIALPALAAGMIGLATFAAGGAEAASGDVDAGHKAFAACAACHGTTAGARKLGPTLFGVVGRKAGTVAGFNSSPALAKSGKTWTPDQLDAFIANPRKAVPGTRMPYAGMRDAAQRKALIAYLATLK